MKGKLVVLSFLLLPGMAFAQEFEALIKQGQPVLERVEQAPNYGQQHVRSGTAVAQGEEFPLSGPHWPKATPSGFYEEPQPKGQLIHALEHGQVVIYYDKPGFAALSMLQRWGKDRAANWSGIVAVPHEGLGEKLVLTAWRHRLNLPSFDRAAVVAFVDAYSGRGPENPVR
jgi:hypothetical protein